MRFLISFKMTSAMACWVGVSSTGCPKTPQVAHGQTGDLGKVLAAYRDGERLLLETLAVAVGTVRGTHIALDVPLHAHRGRLRIPSLQVVDKPLPCRLIIGAEGAGVVLHVDLFAAVTVHEQVKHPLGKVLDGDVQREMIVPCKRAEVHLRDGRGIEVPAADAGLRPRATSWCGRDR